MFKKLRNRFLLLNMLITSLVMIAAFSIVYLTIYNNTQTEIERKLNNVTGSFIINEPGKLPIPGPGQGAVENDHEPKETYQKVTSEYVPSFVITVDSLGKIIKINSLLDMPEEQYKEAAEIAWNRKNTTEIKIGGRSWKYKIAPMEIIRTQEGRTETETADIYQISFIDITDMKNNLSSLFFTLTSVGLGMLAVIFIISTFYANRSIKPISETWERQKQFIADASHELKTPLTTIITNCAVLEANENETIKSQKEWLGYIKIGVERMSKLVNDLLTLARAEGMKIQMQKEPFSMSKMITETIQSMEAAAESKKISVNHKIEITDDINGYKESVRQIFTILYENAVKYTNEGGRIDVWVRRTKKGIACTVKNTGPGIQAKDLPYIFDRFFRSDAARSTDTNSYGLGLSIAKSISEQIGGKITTKSVENAWTEFTLTFKA